MPARDRAPGARRASSGRTGGDRFQRVRRHAGRRRVASARCTGPSGRDGARRSRSRSSTRAPATALLADLNQLAGSPGCSRCSCPASTSSRCSPSCKARVAEELDYALEATRQAAVRRGVRRTTRRSSSRGSSRRAERCWSPSGSTARRCRGSSRGGTTGAARPRRPAAGPVPVLRAGPGRAAARRPAPGQLPAARRRPARRARLRRGRPAAGRPAGADRAAAPAGARRATPRTCSPGCATRASSGRASRSTPSGCSTTCADARAARGRASSASPGPGCARRRPGSADPRSPAYSTGLAAQPAAGVPADPPGDARLASACCASSRPQAPYRGELERWLPGFPEPRRPRKRRT